MKPSKLILIAFLTSVALTAPIVIGSYGETSDFLAGFTIDLALVSGFFWIIFLRNLIRKGITITKILFFISLTSFLVFSIMATIELLYPLNDFISIRTMDEIGGIVIIVPFFAGVLSFFISIIRTRLARKNLKH